VRLSTRRALREGAEKLADARLPLEPLLDEVAALLARELPHDCASAHPVDPMTITMAGCRLLGDPPDGQRIAEYEYLAEDVNSLADLALGPRHCASLTATTGGRPEVSARFRDLLRPSGLGDELRAVFVVDGLCWGAFGCYREAGGFDEDEADALHELSPVLGRAFRAAAVHASAAADAAVAPGVVVLDADRRIRWATELGRDWLRELGFDGEPRGDRPPQAVSSVVERARSTGGHATVRVIGISGRWVEVHASASDEGPGQVAVILQSPPPATIAPLIAYAYGLTDRERELVALVLVGLSTVEIAARLVISVHTVQDHLKSVFDKVGVRSRRALIGRMSLRYGPLRPPGG
jgi:DNA-binding CsgD family transcriptional regulator